MFFTVYRTTNLINGKFYIGKHKTDDLEDDYLGSGKLLKRAIAKHGRENFKKEILHVFDNEDEMNSKEAELVQLNEQSYNLCPGGNGGWGYINSNEEIWRKRNTKAGYEAAKKYMLDPEKNRRNGQLVKELKLGIFKEGCPRGNWLGRKHSPESKEKMRQSSLGKIDGEKNPNYGNMWITNGTFNQRIKKGTEVPEGFRPGRVMK